MSDNLDLVVKMIEDLSERMNGLSGKLDSLAERQVTRHEFEGLNNRLDTMVVRSEFESFKQFSEQRLVTTLSSINERFDSTAQANKLPPWLTGLLAIIAFIATATQGLWGLFHR